MLPVGGKQILTPGSSLQAFLCFLWPRKLMLSHNLGWAVIRASSFLLSWLGIPCVRSLGPLEWVAISSSRGSSQHRDCTHVSCLSCVGRRVLHHWATWETLLRRYIWRSKWNSVLPNFLFGNSFYIYQKIAKIAEFSYPYPVSPIINLLY